ncbi:hypothetical protein M2650_16085 [Luteimonas sp. SX5]|uniref:DUF4393 domain-containing protein n=1 Tax=Luteimonas galliterrae TaxID=2940486 RepID=A0ABT0MMQ5_9GAMM|nr:hypothetical protein [Luteimonas galliterrae]MCL1636142.1 hypothetical protein [Luteimonas galliterrae]
MATDKLVPPKQSKGDTLHALAKAGLSAVPIIGGPSVELFQHVVQPPLEKRRIEWMAYVGEKLVELEQRGVDIQQLSENEEFVSAVLHASQLAVRTHRQEKREALRNALFNIASGKAPEESLQQIFLEYIDSFTELHVQLLKFFQQPPGSANVMMGALSSVIEQGIPGLRGKGQVYGQVWNDLVARGLVGNVGLQVMMTGHGLAEKRTTPLGDAFLAFISEPAL